MKHKRKTISGVIAALIIALCTWGYDHLELNLFTPKAPVEQTVAPLQNDMTLIWSRGRGLNAAENAAEHFKKHGEEFGFDTEEDYVAAAIAFTTNPPEEVMKNKQRDGDTAFYNPKTAEYAVKSKRGLIRTYFRLDPRIHGYKTNLDYFKAQEARQNKRPANDNQR